VMMRDGSIAREVFGDEFVEHFGGSREHEIRLWDEAVTDWYVFILFSVVHPFSRNTILTLKQGGEEIYGGCVDYLLPQGDMCLWVGKIGRITSYV